MTAQQKAIIKGFTKMGASVEVICLSMGIDGYAVEKVAKKVKVLKNEKATSKRNNRSLRSTKTNIHNGKNKRANKKVISRPIQTHTGL